MAFDAADVLTFDLSAGSMKKTMFQRLHISAPLTLTFFHVKKLKYICLFHIAMADQ